MGLSLVASATPALAAGKKVCTIADSKLDELSGLIATSKGYIVINDSSEQASRKRIFYLGSKCAVTKSVQYSGAGPRDTEDLAVSPDGKTLWVADIGDNPDSTERRSNVGLWSMPIDGSKKPTLHRLSYPDGKHDAEALLMNGDGTPIIITKTGGKAGLYSPAAGAMKANNETPVAMTKVGEVTLPKTTTDNPFGAIGRLMVTGAARSPDGSKVALRTYADAFEYEVSGGDVVKALTSGEPRVTALVSDQFGEALAYSADGKSFLTVSDLGELDSDVDNNVYQYTPSTAAPKATTAATVGGADNAANSRSWIDELTLKDITYMIGAVGVLGALLVGAGVFGILRARGRPPAGPAGAKGKKKGGPDPTVGRQPVPGASSAVSAVGADRPYAGSGYDDYDRQNVRPDRPADDYQPAGQVYGSRPGGGSGGSGGVYGTPRPNVYGGPPSQNGYPESRPY
ncbi:hypothetical protein [Micromonospora sp. CPCC 206061]|uniref:hypothetical protein n=1 Tax=Micromonospora sp. CPCC 206061 TaxID=3122410 RepID=UPI002FF0254B